MAEKPNPGQPITKAQARVLNDMGRVMG